MIKEHEKKAEELRQKVYDAKVTFENLSSPANKLSTDPITQKGQLKELENANLALKEAKATYDLFLDRIAKIKAEDNVDAYFAKNPVPDN